MYCNPPMSFYFGFGMVSWVVIPCNCRAPGMYCEGGFRQLLMYYTRIYPKPDGKIQKGTRGLLKLGLFLFGG